MSERRNAALVLALCAYLRKQITKAEDYAKEVADVTFPDEKTAGSVNGTVVSYTSRVSRRPSPPFTVTDQPGFVAWVQQRWPTEIEPAIRPAFLSMLAEKAERHDGILIDDEGEVCEYVKLADPIVYTMTKLTKAAFEALGPLVEGVTFANLPEWIAYEQPHQLDEEHRNDNDDGQRQRGA